MSGARGEFFPTMLAADPKQHLPKLKDLGMSLRARVEMGVGIVGCQTGG